MTLTSVNYLSGHLKKTKNHKLMIIGFELIAVRGWIKKGWALVLHLPKNEKFLLEILPMSVSDSCASFMVIWFTTPGIFKNIIYLVKNIMTSQS